MQYVFEDYPSVNGFQDRETVQNHLNIPFIIYAALIY